MVLNPANPTPDAATNVPDRNSLQQADATKISAKDLTGTTVFDADNQTVGDVGDVIVTKDGKIDAVVVDVGGFLGIGEKPVAIAFEDLDVRTDQNGDLTVYTSFTKDQLDNAPKYDKSAYENQRDQMRLHTQG
jgi:sporulation protein YlmC with PRC-barrel domain